MANRVLRMFISSARMFYRSKSAVFWTIAFPVMLILIFGAIFSGGPGGGYTVYIQDQSDSPASHAYIDGLNATRMFDQNGVQGAGIRFVPQGVDLAQFIKDNSISSAIVIPANFTHVFDPGAPAGTANLTIMTDPTSGSAMVVSSIATGVASQMNLMIAHGVNVIVYGTQDIVGYKYIDFFLPGVIGLMTMTTTINWTVGLMTRYRENGIFKKLATTPMTRIEWLTTEIMWQLIVVFISLGVIIAVGVLVFGMALTLTPLAVAVIILSSAMFSAMGMIIARYIKEEETASSAASAITFPMMFLAGTFFPLEQMPQFLQAVAAVLPLTYVNNALRDSMIYGNTVGAMNNFIIVAVLAAVFFIIGVAVSSWKTE
jgi:ABC-2 type transport system permease protein